VRSRPRSEADLDLDGEIFSFPLRLPSLHLHPSAIATIFRTVYGCQECVTGRRPYTWGGVKLTNHVPKWRYDGYLNIRSEGALPILDGAADLHRKKTGERGRTRAMSLATEANKWLELFCVLTRYLATQITVLPVCSAIENRNEATDGLLHNESGHALHWHRYVFGHTGFVAAGTWNRGRGRRKYRKRHVQASKSGLYFCFKLRSS
jgi:hypothetical protein